MTDAVCDLIQRVHDADGETSPELGVVRDAMLLARVEEQKKDGVLPEDSLQKTLTACRTVACQEQAETLIGTHP
jgi:hypothetical protein